MCWLLIRVLLVYMCRLRVALSRFSMSAVETWKKPARIPSPQMPTALLWTVALIASISHYRMSAESLLSELHYLLISSCDRPYESVQSSMTQLQNGRPLWKSATDFLHEQQR